MELQYRYLAKERIRKATDLLNSGTDDNLIYACLEIRKCIEALSYDLLISYLSEAPLKALETWQPDKVLKELLRIDPSADQTSQVRMCREGPDGAPDGRWTDLGEDRRLKAAWVAKVYHQLGSFLHVPTIKQSREDVSLDTKTVRQRVEPIRARLAHVLDATIWNANFSVSATFSCTVCEVLLSVDLQLLRGLSRSNVATVDSFSMRNEGPTTVIYWCLIPSVGFARPATSPVRFCKARRKRARTSVAPTAEIAPRWVRSAG